jgi:hypothetical protein
VFSGLDHDALNYSFHPMLNSFKHGRHRSRPVQEIASGLPEADIFEFHRNGKLPPGADRVVLDVAGSKITVPIAWEPVHYGGARPWFRCPRCSARRRFLRVRDDRLGCVPCLNLVYRSRVVRWKTSRSLHRVRRLRARLGLDPRPLTPLPLHPVRIKGYDRLTRELELCERELLGMFARKR